MTEAAMPALRLWSSAEEMALSALKAELDGLAAMMSLWSGKAPAPRPTREEDFDNLPV